MLSNGYVKLYRKILDHPIFTQLPASVLKVWMVCLIRANIEPTSWYDGHQQVEIPAGAFIFSQDTLAKDCHLSRHQIRTALQHLQNLRCVAIKSTNKYSLLVIEKWTIYQLAGPTRGQQYGQQAAIGGPTSGQQVATEEEYKNTRREEEHTQALVRVSKPKVSDLNDQTSQRWEEFWGKYPRKVNKDAAAQNFVSYVTLETESKVFACLARYLASAEVARGAIMNPDKWLLQQHRDNWLAEWPPAERPEAPNGLPPPRRWVEPADDIPPSRPLPLPPELMERLKKGKG